MNPARSFFKQTFVGGILVLLPIGILVLCFDWVFDWVRGLIHPLTKLVIKSNGLPPIIGDIIVVILIVLVCFVVGYIVSTGAGKWLHHKIDHHVLRHTPGYRMIKEVVGQLFGDSANSPFTNGEVALAKLFGTECETRATVLVTSKHENGFYTVFVPTGPNPTSGLIYHLPEDQVTILEDVRVDQMMRTIIACGAGSGELLKGKV